MIKTKNLFLTIALAVLAIVQGWAQEPFTFAQVTDIHLNSNDPKPLEYLNMTIADINKNPNVDFVLITGDLADNGDNASLEQLADALKALNKKYYVLTGNHETTWSESGMAKFSQLFGSERMEFEPSSSASPRARSSRWRWAMWHHKTSVGSATRCAKTARARRCSLQPTTPCSRATSTTGTR